MMHSESQTAPLVMARDKEVVTDISQWPLPSDEDFFAAGEDNGCLKNCACLCCDLRRLFCMPSCMWQPKDNMACHFGYHLCFGEDVGKFIWPLRSPCGCCCCCPCKIWSILCCCASPESRCDSLRYIGQRLLYTGAFDTDLIYPIPNGRNPVSEHTTYQGHSGPWKGANPNQFVSWFESLGDLLTSVPILSNGCAYLNKHGWAPNTTWQPASKYVGQSDRQMNDAANYGGMWLYPSSFKKLPTPPGAKDKHGNPLSTNVAPGKPGSRVIFWAHGSAYAVLQAKDFFWLFGQMLCEQTGNVVLLGEYGMTSDVFYPQQIDQWARDYKKLVDTYGARNVILAGDSAGCNLLMATLLKECHGIGALPPPGGIILMSPWVDISDEALLTDAVKKCPT